MAEPVVKPTRYVVRDRTDVYDDDVASYSGTVRAHPRFVQQLAAATTADDDDDGSTGDVPAAAAVRRIPMLMDGRGTATMKDGRVYDGDVRLGMFDGDGTMRFPDGSVYDGAWADHLQQGLGSLEGPLIAFAAPDPANGPDATRTKTARSYSYTGYFRRGERDGQGEELFMPSGDRFVGTFRDGKREGLGRLVRGNGDVVDGVYKEGLLHGLCTVTFSHGDVFVCRHVAGEPHGVGEYTQVSSGDKYFETFDRGTCTSGVLTVDCGHTTCRAEYTSTGARYEGGWLRTAAPGSSDRRGVRAGHGRLVFPNGDVYEGGFEADAMEGEGVVSYNPNPPAAEDDDDEEDDYRQDVLDLADGATNAVSAAIGLGNGNDDDDDESVGSADLAVVPADGDDGDGGGGGGAEAPADVYAEMRNTTAFDEREVDGAKVVRFEGLFHRGLKDGRGAMVLADGRRVEGFWSRGTRHGVFHTTSTIKSAATPPTIPADVDAATPAEPLSSSAALLGEQRVGSEYYCRDVERRTLAAAADLARRVGDRELNAAVEPVDFAATATAPQQWPPAVGIAPLKSALRRRQLDVDGGDAKGDEAGTMAVVARSGDHHVGADASPTADAAAGSVSSKRRAVFAESF